MTADLALCLRAVLERPDDDLPRLMYADAAQEQGDMERAAFIRSPSHSCHGDRSVGQPCPVWPYGERVFCPLCQYLVELGVPWQFLGEDAYTIRHGFLNSIACTWADWKARHEKLYWWGPKTCDKCLGGKIMMQRFPQANYAIREMTVQPSIADLPRITSVDCSACRGTGELPGAEMSCKRCCGLGCNTVGIGERPFSPICPDCSGTGRVLRPVPDGAMPLEWITLTVAPDDDEAIRHGATVQHIDGKPVWTFTTWPRLKFNLPSLP